MLLTAVVFDSKKSDDTVFQPRNSSMTEIEEVLNDPYFMGVIRN